MYFRPSDERGRTSSVESAGTGSISLSSFIVTCAYARAVLALLGLDLRDEAHPRAADPHLEALHELGGVRQVRLQVVGRDERQARVRVVGEEDRDDRNQHGHGSHQHRACGEGGLGRGAGSLRLTPEQVVEPGLGFPERRGGALSLRRRSASRFCSRRLSTPGRCSRRAGPGAGCRWAARCPSQSACSGPRSRPRASCWRSTIRPRGRRTSSDTPGWARARRSSRRWSRARRAGSGQARRSRCSTRVR